MKHCEKCLYYEKCKAEMDEAPNDIFTFFPYNEDCPHFKNKADFVEVVRCRECKFAYENRYLGVTYCEMTDHKIKQHHFCSYGERKDTQ